MAISLIHCRDFLKSYISLLLFFILYSFALYLLTCSIIVFDNYKNNKPLFDLPSGFSLNFNLKS